MSEDVSDKSCFHCGLPIPVTAHYPIEIEGHPRQMCCRGCQAVAQAIVENGLTDYYRHRTALPDAAQELVPDELQKLALYDHPSVQKSFVHAQGENIREASLILEGITCAACIWLNERHLHQLDGVLKVQVNYASHRARITWDDQVIKLSRILKEIQLLGYSAHPFDTERQETLRKKQRAQDLRRIAVAGLCAAQVMMIAVALYAGAAFGMEKNTADMLRYFSMGLALPVLVYAAVPFYRSAWYALAARRVNMDVPVTLAIVVAFTGSVWTTWQGSGVVYFDAISMFTLFLLGSRFLERNAQEKSVEAAENLLKLAPAMATRITDGRHESVPVLELSVGDMILAKPGEAIAADAEVMEGESAVDESLLTGESRPISKVLGDRVIAGSINLESPLILRVSCVGEETVLAGIVRMLDRAVAEKPRLAQLADKVASQFTFTILLLAVVVAGVWWWIDPSRAFEIVLAVLVVTCPCALSLAAPAAFAAAGTHLLKRGILLTRGHALETLSKVNHVVVDKTGTLTFGKPVIQKIMAFSEVSAEQCLNIAASLELASEHPLAESFLGQVAKQHLLLVRNAQNVPGKGVQGEIDGKIYSLGSNQLSPTTYNVKCPEDMPLGATPVWLSDGEQALALFILSDGLRSQSHEMVARLHQRGTRVTILSGDTEDAVAHVAKQAGIEAWRSAMKPEDKLAALREFQGRGDIVAMVGDGVNDAPVLAGSDVSIAMGGGTQVARSSSDIVLLSENLLDVRHALETGSMAMLIMRQNFTWAIVYNLLALPFAAAGLVPPWLAAIGMSASSLVVVLNALRLR
ncbi:MAG: cadmium-translocating P-type ATPase [Sulfuricella sp.]|nr:cadmium-translocating P-type ATPase [Sulfuricella sp.]